MHMVTLRRELAFPMECIWWVEGFPHGRERGSSDVDLDGRQDQIQISSSLHFP